MAPRPETSNFRTLRDERPLKWVTSQNNYARHRWFTTHSAKAGIEVVLCPNLARVANILATVASARSGIHRRKALFCTLFGGVDQEQGIGEAVLTCR